LVLLAANITFFPDLPAECGVKAARPDLTGRCGI
jgi:hypothetical protein